MKEKLSKLLNKDVSHLIIAPFTEAEALSFQYAFLIGFIDHVIHGGFAVNLFAKLKDTPSTQYLLDPMALFAVCLCLGYTAYLSYIVFHTKPVQAKVKFRVAMVMHTLLSIVSVANGIRLLDSKHGINTIYDVYIFGLSLFYLIYSLIKFSLLKASLGSSSWGALTKNDVISKMKEDQITHVQFVAILISSVIIYAVFRSFNGIALTILQTYLLTIIVQKAFTRIR